MSEAAYANITIDQGADFSIQIIWTDALNEAYQVVHPMRMQARATTGQVMIDLSSNDQVAEDQTVGLEPSLVYSTEGGVIQAILPASLTEQLPVGELNYDLFVSYVSDTSDFITGNSSSAIRRAKVLYGKIRVEGRVTRNV